MFVGEIVGRSEGITNCKPEAIGVAVEAGLVSETVQAASSTTLNAKTKGQHEALTIVLL